jgi:hypothetical protein
MDIVGSFALSISDINLDFKGIEDNFPIKPSKIIRKGEMIGKLKNIEAPYDIWSYEIAIGDCENIFKDLSSMLDDLLPYCKFIKDAGSRYENVIINCYFRSEYGQMGFRLSNEIIKKLEKVGLSLDFHILSFGAVDNE